MDAAHDGTLLEGEPAIDAYLLQFWPAPPAPDRVVKVTSKEAKYWHGWVREIAPAPTAAS